MPSLNLWKYFQKSGQIQITNCKGDNAFCTYCKTARHYAFEYRKRIYEEAKNQPPSKKASIANTGGKSTDDPDFW